MGNHNFFYTAPTMDDAWNTLLNPYEHSIEAGRKEGTLSGLESGFKEGYKLGHVTALDIGIEVGFCHGVATTLLESIDALRIERNMDDRHYNRLKQRLHEFIHVIHAFPDPSTIFDSKNVAQNHHPDSCMESSVSSLIESPPTEKTWSHPIARAVDITEALENIRSRFKILMAILHAPQLNLNVVMNRTVEMKSSEINTSATANLEKRPNMYDGW